MKCDKTSKNDTSILTHIPIPIHIRFYLRVIITFSEQRSWISTWSTSCEIITGRARHRPKGTELHLIVSLGPARKKRKKKREENSK
jgi:hypothetical protein